MSHDIFRKMEDLIGAPSIAALSNTFERHMCFYGFDKYALLFQKDDASPEDAPVILATYDKPWTDHYFEHGYDRIDPVFQTARKQVQPFMWSDLWKGGELTPIQQRMFHEAKEYKLSFGLGIPIRVIGRENALLSLVSSVCAPREVERVATEHMTEIILLTSYFHQIANTLIRQQEEKNNKNKQDNLTDREKEVLLWIARGKTDDELATILGISVHTVREHVRALFRKMNVTTRSQACVTAILNGILKGVFSLLYVFFACAL